jgi:uncharacterized protein (TIGR02145 family)
MILMKNINLKNIILFLILCSGCTNPDPSKNHEASFQSMKGTFQDERDGKTYRWIKIGRQVWMAENLNYVTSSGSWAFDDSISNSLKFGRLYDWDAALTACPSGWHLPSDAEWSEMCRSLKGADTTGNLLRTNGMVHWKRSRYRPVNTSGFSALPGGARFVSGSYSMAGETAYFWTSTSTSGLTAFCRYLFYNRPDMGRISKSKEHAFSCRCLKDQ